MLRNYILQNWALILVSIAFVISLKTTGFRDKPTVRRMYCLIAGVFLLSVVVFTEFYLVDLGGYILERTILMAIRYSATPLIVALLLYTLKKNQKQHVFIPALLLIVLNIISVFNGIVFKLESDGTLVRGPLGYIPYIISGLYGVVLIWSLYRQSNRLYTEIVPIAFLAFAFAGGLILPFVFGPAYSHIFCITIAIALYVYYVFSIHQLSKKDPLTDTLNLQAFYEDSESSPQNITALISIDMNGLKTINDQYGHAEGDKALTALARCLRNAAGRRQSLYRIGGDEFVILCRSLSEEEVLALIRNIEEETAQTDYRCSAGYSYKGTGKKSISEMLKESDVMMYSEKAKFYVRSGKDRRQGSGERPRD
ncbi:MAG: diguanylate cyclase [Clostridia bacterium]|nr:diguanylate cyclase [Clostridia bacterium]